MERWRAFVSVFVRILPVVVKVFFTLLIIVYVYVVVAAALLADTYIAAEREPDLRTYFNAWLLFFQLMTGEVGQPPPP